MGETPQRILMVRLSAIGDVINTIPSLRALRRAFPDAHVAWLVEDRAASVIEGDRDLDARHVFERRRWDPRRGSGPVFRSLAEIVTLVRTMRAAKYDVALDFQGNLKSGMLTWLSGARRRIGFRAADCKEGSFVFTNERVTPSHDSVHRVHRFFSLAERLARGSSPSAPQVSISNMEMADAEQRIAGACGTRRPRIAVHPGTSGFGRFKRWPTASYAHVIDMLVDRYGARVCLVTGPDDRGLADEVFARMSQTAVMLPRTRSLRGLAAMLKCVDLFIGADSGPAHLASAVGTPVVAVFGPKDPAVYAPYGPKTAVVRADLPCSPCKRRKCDHAECMTAVTPEAVISAAEELLNGAGYGAASDAEQSETDEGTG